MKIESIMLDVDGTLWDSTPIVAKAWTKVIRENGLKAELSADDLKNLFGKTMKVIADEMLPETEPGLRYRVMDACCALENSAIEEDCSDICYPGVVETIRELAKRVPVCIVSNCHSGYIEVLLKKTGLGDCITDTECYGDTGKNKDETMKLVMERNHLKSPVYVGDTQGDLMAAEKAGVPFIFASYGYGKPERWDGAIGSFKELLSLVEQSR